MRKNKTKILEYKDIEKLLSQQTIVILNAVDEKLERIGKKFKQEFTIIKENLRKLETRVSQLEQKLI